jgi:uncharacterized protein YnzC (UPF0291/DUF896 family)
VLSVEDLPQKLALRKQYLEKVEYREHMDQMEIIGVFKNV